MRSTENFSSGGISHSGHQRSGAFAACARCNRTEAAKLEPAAFDTKNWKELTLSTNGKTWLKRILDNF